MRYLYGFLGFLDRRDFVPFPFWYIIYPMRKNHFYLFISLALFAISFISALALLERDDFALKQLGNVTNVLSDVQPSQKLSEEELVSMVKPSVVRIVTRAEVEASIPLFRVSFKDFTVKTVSNQKPIKISVPVDISGSGFVINPDGYILTNAHVISDVTIKKNILAPFILLAIDYDTASLSKEDAKNLEKRSKQEGFDFGRQILDYLIQESSFTFRTKKTVVLNPTSAGTTREEILNRGFTAEVISVNDNFYKDDKDIAVLKISEKNLPSLRLGAGDKLSVGGQVYVFGFPSNAEFNSNNLLESTFTKGVVNAFKNSQNTDFKIFQTDAKISTGSSGGPLFDADGQVAGLVTFGTNSSGQSNGDNFAFAVPAEIAKTVLSNSFIINDDGSYGAHLKTGLLFLRDKHCKNAITEFNLAKSVNEKFGVARYVDPYIEKCNALISYGLSIDSKWDEFMAKVRSMGMLVWALFAAGAFLLIVLGIGVVVLLKHLKKDEVELKHLEHVIEHKNENIEVTSPQSPFTTVVKQEKSVRDIVIEKTNIENKEVSATTPGISSAGDPKPANEALLVYIKQARQAGLTFQAIEKALKDAGWNDDEISRALAVPQQ